MPAPAPSTGPEADAARARLAALSRAYRKAEEAMVKARKDLRAGIGDVLADKALRVSEVTEVVPYKHNEVTKIAKEAREAGARPEDRDAPET